jgi:phenylacetic acid degradation operon negative regulatory protein
MSAKILAEEVLLLMTYAFDLFAMPTFRKWDQSYEGWLYANGFLKRVQYLERQKFLEREAKRDRKRMARVFRVTEAGRQHALGGRDPEQYWQREWDGVWRLIVFDLPTGQHKTRSTLIRWLRHNGFGYLQDSVWISAFPVPDMAKVVKGVREDAEMFTLLKCQCEEGFSDASLVQGAWPFKAIHEAYRAYRDFARDARKRLGKQRLHPRDLFALLRDEGERWAAAFEPDPLLPESLWPSDYNGRAAWKDRTDLLRAAASQVRGK